MIKLQTYSLNNLLLTKEVLSSYVNNFWSDVFSQITDHSNKHLLLMCKVEFDNPSLGQRSIANLRKVNFSDKDLFIDYLIQRLGILTESYTTQSIKNLTFTYVIKKGLTVDNQKYLEDHTLSLNSTHNFNNLNLPISMNPEDYGTIISDSFVQTKGDSFHRFIVENNSRIYQIDRTLDNTINYVTIKGKITLSWIDTVVDTLDGFKRDIGKSIIYFAEDGEIVLREKQLTAKPFDKLPVDKNIRSSFITMDIETIKSNSSKLIPYLICAYNGVNHISSYAKMVNGIIDQKELFSSFISQLVTFFNKDENNLMVYAHNLSSFDGVFLLKHLLPFGKVRPYLISAFNGSNYITSYGNIVNGVIDQKELFNSFMLQLLTFISKWRKIALTVYAHNLSSFDGVFLMKHLLPFGKVEPLIHNGKIISIKLTLSIKGYKDKTILFKDSYLLLPVSLRKLCNAFNILIPKAHFPFLLNDIFYKGIFPAFNYWTGVSLDEHLSLSKQFLGKVWSFQEEAIKYCKLDCKCLHEILTQFNELIFTNFSVSIHNSLTLPALAMKIYKTKFMPENTIHQLIGKPYNDISQSYTGGAVDVYIPHNRVESLLSRKFKKLFYYDVNSLYPFVMANTVMPIGRPKAFTGNILRIDPQAYGHFYVEVTSPDNLQHPILQKRVKTPEGIRTVAGLGTWKQWIYSEEMYNAMKHGYKFTVIEGYEFTKGNIFKEFVETMYNLRMSFPKNHPMNLIAKLLMNSLYGKFGMKPTNTMVEIFDISDISI
jgi:DNA polymerase type B, organellar and viral